MERSGLKFFFYCHPVHHEEAGKGYKTTLEKYKNIRERVKLKGGEILRCLI